MGARPVATHRRISLLVESCHDFPSRPGFQAEVRPSIPTNVRGPLHMRNVWKSSLTGRVPAFVLLSLPGAFVAACSVPDAVDGPLAEAEAQLGSGGSAGTSAVSVGAGGGFCQPDGFSA